MTDKNETTDHQQTPVPEAPSADPLQTVEGLKDLLLRTQANFENYRKQTQKRMEELQQMAARDVLVQLLPVIDNLELALKNANPSHLEDFVKGVTLISDQFTTLLGELGVHSIPTDGKFDPFLHEAIMKSPSDKSENIILEEFQRGFTLNGKVIRHAKVKVSAGIMQSKPEHKSENKNENKKQ